MTERAQGVLHAQGRLRALLRANSAVAGDLSLQVVLRHIATAARDLVDARYAALGVVGADGGLDEFVHIGMEENTVAAIGELPRGHGILGHLINHPEPIRISNLAQHPAAVGFPAAHPPMGSFLGVPIRVRDQVFGNLYLTESRHGQFSDEDEQLIAALAASAGVAIQNARLYEDAERRRQWQAASTETAQLIFSTSSAQRSLDIVLRQAMNAAGGQLAFLASLVDGDRVSVTAAVGAFEGDINLPSPAAGSLVSDVLGEGKPVLVENCSTVRRTDSLLTGSVGSVIIAPFSTPDSGNGALAIGRLTRQPQFHRTDLDQLADFAHHAGLALELRRAREEREHLQLLQTRERIAADLHDHVIQELFATGMGLEGVAHGLERVDQKDRILTYVEDIDATIRRIRTSIFQLHNPTRDGTTSLQQRLLEIVEQERPALGFSAHIEFSGPLDTEVTPDLSNDLCAVVREALSNIARHAHATTTRLQVTLSGQQLTAQITDDGIGLGASPLSGGLTNLHHRAAKHHGGLDLSRPEHGGTCLTWTVRSVG